MKLHPYFINQSISIILSKPSQSLTIDRLPVREIAQVESTLSPFAPSAVSKEKILRDRSAHSDMLPEYGTFSSNPSDFRAKSTTRRDVDKQPVAEIRLLLGWLLSFYLHARTSGATAYRAKARENA